MAGSISEKGYENVEYLSLAGRSGKEIVARVGAVWLGIYGREEIT